MQDLAENKIVEKGEYLPKLRIFVRVKSPGNASNFAYFRYKNFIYRLELIAYRSYGRPSEYSLKRWDIHQKEDGKGIWEKCKLELPCANKKIKALVIGDTLHIFEGYVYENHLVFRLNKVFSVFRIWLRKFGKSKMNPKLLGNIVCDYANADWCA